MSPSRSRRYTGPTEMLSEAVRLMESGEGVNVEAVKYLNRLSDHLFVAARRANANGASDIKWKPGATR